MHELLTRLTAGLACSLAMVAGVVGTARSQAAATTQISEDFAFDPHWEGRNNTPPAFEGGLFDRFGIMNVQISGKGMTLWLDDIRFTAQAREK